MLTKGSKNVEAGLVRKDDQKREQEILEMEVMKAVSIMYGVWPWV